MAFGHITSWQIDGKTMETVRDFIFLGSKITADGDCTHEIKTLAPWKKSYDQPTQCFKKQRHYFVNKHPSRQGYGFPVVMYGCEIWTIKKAECRRINAFELWFWSPKKQSATISTVSLSICHEVMGLVTMILVF